MRCLSSAYPQGLGENMQEVKDSQQSQGFQDRWDALQRNHKFKNPFHKPKRVKIDTTVVIPSDQDETEIDEVIRIEK